MNKKEITIKISKDAGITGLQAKKALASLLQGIKDSLRKGERVTLSGFGSLEIKKRKARKGRNPKTGEIIQISQKNKIKFNPSRIFEDSL